MAQKTITVTGRGNVSVKPDITRVSLYISAVRPEYIDSFNLAQDYNRQIKGIMTRLGLDEKLPKTTRFDITKETRHVYIKGDYDHEEFVGYKLRQDVDIDLSMDTAVLGSFLEALGKELTDTEISISYAVSDSKQAQYDLLEDAAKDSKEKALRIARAVGCELGEVLNINYSWRRIDFLREESYDPRLGCDKMAAPGSSLDIEPEDLKASDDVTIVWEIKEK